MSSKSIWITGLILSTLATHLTLRERVSAQESHRPELWQDIGPGELTLTLSGLIGLGVLQVWGDQWLGSSQPSMGPPAEGSHDLRFSRWAHPSFNPKDQWLWGTPDLMGYIAPAVTLTYYVGGSVVSGGAGWGGAHPHEALAFTQGLSWAMFSTVLLKHLVGRERPYVIRGRRGEIDSSAVDMPESEQRLSFPSGHSTAIAATSFFVAADLSDALITGPLKKREPWVQAAVGRVLPYLGASAMSWFVMYSRVKDQRHWLSDTLTGALIGVTSALLSYHTHFNSRGQPY